MTDHPSVSAIKEALRSLSDSGTRLFLMHGNRDFLLGQAFCTQTGATLLDDPTVIPQSSCLVILPRQPLHPRCGIHESAPDVPQPGLKSKISVNHWKNASPLPVRCAVKARAVSR